MRIRANKGGELNMHGPGVHWIHAAGDERDFPDDVGKRILTNKNYEKAGSRRASPSAEKKIETSAVIKRKEDPENKEKKKEGK